MRLSFALAILLSPAINVAISADDLSVPAVRRTEVRVADIGEKVVLIGLLGRPLREMTTVRGVWVGPPEEQPKPDDQLRFRITHVDGKPLAEPVEFLSSSVEIVRANRKAISPSAGEAWEARVYETFTDYGRPQGYWEELKVPIGRPIPRSKTQLFGVLRPASKLKSKPWPYMVIEYAFATA